MNPREEYLEKLEQIVREEYITKIFELETKIDSIIKKLDLMEKDTSKMSGHIDFIDTTYSKLKTPLFWMCDRVNLLRGVPREPPIIKNSTVEDQD